MARVPYLTEDDATDENREALSRNINLYRAVGHCAGGATNFSRIGLWLRFDSKFDPRLRELGILTVGYVTRAKYEWAQHVGLGYQFGVTDADLDRLKLELDGTATDLPEIERNIILGAAEMTRGTAMSQARWDALAAHFNHELMVELTMAIGFYVGLVRVLETLQIDLDDDVVKHLERHPLLQ